MSATTYIELADGRRTVYNLPECGQVVTVGNGGKKVRVKVARVATSAEVVGCVIVTGYRVYRNGCMSDVMHSYPASVTNIDW